MRRAEPTGETYSAPKDDYHPSRDKSAQGRDPAGSDHRGAVTGRKKARLDAGLSLSAVQSVGFVLDFAAGFAPLVGLFSGFAFRVSISPFKASISSLKASF